MNRYAHAPAPRLAQTAPTPAAPVPRHRAPEQKQKPLDPAAQAERGTRLGHHFSDVRVFPAGATRSVQAPVATGRGVVQRMNEAAEEDRDPPRKRLKRVLWNAHQGTLQSRYGFQTTADEAVRQLESGEARQPDLITPFGTTRPTIQQTTGDIFTHTQQTAFGGQGLGGDDWKYYGQALDTAENKPDVAQTILDSAQTNTPNQTLQDEYQKHAAAKLLTTMLVSEKGRMPGSEVHGRGTLRAISQGRITTFGEGFGEGTPGFTMAGKGGWKRTLEIASGKQEPNELETIAMEEMSDHDEGDEPPEDEEFFKTIWDAHFLKQNQRLGVERPPPTPYEYSNTPRAKKARKTRKRNRETREAEQIAAKEELKKKRQKQRSSRDERARRRKELALKRARSRQRGRKQRR